MNHSPTAIAETMDTTTVASGWLVVERVRLQAHRDAYELAGGGAPDATCTTSSIPAPATSPTARGAP